MPGEESPCFRSDEAEAPAFEINGCKREDMIASGSMIVHEVYVDSHGGAGGDPGGAR
ncbi:MAG: hypothetical protein Q7J47_02205 [Azoarcus sp.]|nr:hypothetical protein [Azoarcus sp.]